MYHTNYMLFDITYICAKYVMHALDGITDYPPSKPAFCKKKTTATMLIVRKHKQLHHTIIKKSGLNRSGNVNFCFNYSQ